MLVRPLRAWIHYHVLAQLDLGADAANIHAGDPPPAWATALLARYQAAPDRLALQHTPMTGRTTADPTLQAAFDAAVEASTPTIEHAWQTDDPQPRHERFHLEVAPALQACRRLAWSGAPPPLLIWDVPALRHHGRAAHNGKTRIVATSLAEPSDHVFCQLLHEEMHPVSDPIVAEMFGGLSTRDTRAGTPGFAIHHALEVAAVEAGRQIVDQAAPQLRAAYRRWCARNGMADSV